MKKIALITAGVREKVLPGDGGEAWFAPMPPLWALALASALRARVPSAKVDILDEQLLGAAGVRRALRARRYDLAGFSPVAYTYGVALEYARLAKRRGAFVVLGGHYAPPLAAEIFALRGPGSPDHCVDAIVRYDGEEAVCDLASGLPPARVRNLVRPGRGGRPLENPVSAPELAALPPVDYALADLKKYFRLQPRGSRGMLPFVSQRGCLWAQGPGRCVFCSIQSSGGLRALPPAEAARRMRALAGLGARVIFEGSDDFPADRRWLRAFAAEAARGGLPALRIFARASSVTAEAVELLKKSGVVCVSLGIESMSDPVLRGVGKGCGAAVNMRAVGLLAAAGITVRMHVILGLPGETRATLSESFAAFRTMALPASSPERVLLTSTFAVYPGTQVWRRLLAREPRYRGQDLFSEAELFADWLKHFTGLSLADVAGARDALEKLFAARVRLAPAVRP